jgi:3-oxo-5-alpha-steroid 4-dehydrogenase 3 / polyprenol reductase
VLYFPGLERWLTNRLCTAVIEGHPLSFRDLIFRPPSIIQVFGILLFILASGFQHDCHSYLAYLKRQPTAATNSPKDSSSDSKAKDASKEGEGDYKLPSHPAFQPLICPHYTAEIMIYLAMALVSAPQGTWINRTMGCAAIFVLVNLGVTAAGTERWYARRFGEEAVKGKWRLLPGVW